jgi:hypothetical protein
MTSYPLPLLKLRRARLQLRRLDIKIEKWIGQKHYTITNEPDQDYPGNTATYIEAEAPPVEFSLLLGDCLQNMRSGLDHLAYALADAYTPVRSAEVREASEFPIFGDIDRRGRPKTGATRFADAGPGGGLYKIAGVHPEARAVIERAQPYNRGQQFTSHPLWALHELSRIDKHRLIHVTVSSFSGLVLKFPGTKNLKVGTLRPGGTKEFVYQGVVDGRTKLASSSFLPVDPTREMEMDFDTAIDIAFGTPTSATPAGTSVLKTLSLICGYIDLDVVGLLRPFLG